MKTAILYSEQTPLVDALLAKLDGCDVFMSSDFDYKNYDLIISAGYKENVPFSVLKSHLSLLPAFNTDEPVRDTVLAGAKVTGVTVYYTNPERIVAQYPIFIRNDAHYDEIQQELEYLDQTLFPEVVEKIIKNEPFESRTLIGKSQCGGCKGCSR